MSTSSSPRSGELAPGVATTAAATQSESPYAATTNSTSTLNPNVTPQQATSSYMGRVTEKLRQPVLSSERKQRPVHNSSKRVASRQKSIQLRSSQS